MSESKPLVHMVGTDEVKGKARELFEQFEQSGSNVPQWVRVMANCEDILLGFFMMFKATMDDAPLPSVMKWKLAHAVSELNKCEFCVDVAGNKLKQFGLSDEDIAQIKEQADEREQVALRYAKEMTEKAYDIDAQVVADVKKHFNDEELVELTAVVGLFNYINRFNDALGVLPK